MNVVTGVRQPAQARSRERVERILAATEALIEGTPLHVITVAMISERSEVKRATIYQFFPSVQAILKVLGQRFLDELYGDFQLIKTPGDPAAWRATIDTSVDTTVDFYSHHPAACSLFLGDGSLHGLRVIDQDFDQRYVELLRAQLGGGSTIQADEAGDPMQVLVTMCISIISLGVHRFGRITDYYRAQAKDAARAYLAPFLD